MPNKSANKSRATIKWVYNLDPGREGGSDGYLKPEKIEYSTCQSKYHVIRGLEVKPERLEKTSVVEILVCEVEMKKIAWNESDILNF